jgi:hypothetical protein
LAKVFHLVGSIQADTPANMKRIHILFLYFFASSIAQSPILQPMQLFSTIATIDPGTTHSFLLDFSCTSTSGTLVVDINQPAFDNKYGGVFAYASNQPSYNNPYEPFPNPANKSSFQHTTNKGNAIPLPGMVIPYTKGAVYYILVTRSAASSPQYELSAQLTPPQKLAEVGRVNESTKLYEVELPIASPIPKELFFGNKAVFNHSVDWNEYVQYAIPLCQSAIYKIGKTVCLSVTLTGLEPGFLFFQTFSTDPDPLTSNYWQTRPSPPDGNPYTDQSGSSRLPINIFYSYPTDVGSLPAVLYHTINGQGGQGLKPPFPNLFSVFYQIVPCAI